MRRRAFLFAALSLPALSRVRAEGRPLRRVETYDSASIDITREVQYALDRGHRWVTIEYRSMLTTGALVVPAEKAGEWQRALRPWPAHAEKRGRRG